MSDKRNCSLILTNHPITAETLEKENGVDPTETTDDISHLLEKSWPRKFEICMPSETVECAGSSVRSSCVTTVRSRTPQ